MGRTWTDTAGLTHLRPRRSRRPGRSHRPGRSRRPGRSHRPDPRAERLTPSAAPTAASHPQVPGHGPPRCPPAGEVREALLCAPATWDGTSPPRAARGTQDRLWDGARSTSGADGPECPADTRKPLGAARLVRASPAGSGGKAQRATVGCWVSPSATPGGPGGLSREDVCPSVTHGHCRALRTRGGGSCPAATERRLCTDRSPRGSLPHAGRVRAEPRRTVSGRRAPQSPGRRGPTHLRAGHAHGHGAHAAVPPATAESPCAPAVGGCGHAGTGRPPTRSPPGPSLCPRSRGLGSSAGSCAPRPSLRTLRSRAVLAGFAVSHRCPGHVCFRLGQAAPSSAGTACLSVCFVVFVTVRSFTFVVTFYVCFLWRRLRQSLPDRMLLAHKAVTTGSAGSELGQGLMTLLGCERLRRREACAW